MNYVAAMLVRDTRIEKGISLEELSYGICTRSYLSKIESGKVRMSYCLAEALFYRLGMMVPDGIIAVKKSDRRRYNIKGEISAKISSGNNNIEDLLEEYKNCGKSMHKLEQQYYEGYKAIVMPNNSEGLEEKLNKLIEALKYTLPDFELGCDLSEKFFTREEIAFLSNIALVSYRISEVTKNEDLHDIAYFMNEQLIDYQEIVFKNNRARSNIAALKARLAFFDGNDGNIFVGLKHAEDAISEAVNSENITNFIYEFFDKGTFLADMDKLDKAVMYWEKSLSMTCSIGMEYLADKVIPQIKEEYGCEIHIQKFRC